MPLQTLKKSEKSVYGAIWRGPRCNEEAPRKLRRTTFAGRGPQGGHVRDKILETRNKKLG